MPDPQRTPNNPATTQATTTQTLSSLLGIGAGVVGTGTAAALAANQKDIKAGRELIRAEKKRAFISKRGKELMAGRELALVPEPKTSSVRPEIRTPYDKPRNRSFKTSKGVSQASDIMARRIAAAESAVRNAPRAALVKPREYQNILPGQRTQLPLQGRTSLIPSKPASEISASREAALAAAKERATKFRQLPKIAREFPPVQQYNVGKVTNTLRAGRRGEFNPKTGKIEQPMMTRGQKIRAAAGIAGTAGLGAAAIILPKILAGKPEAKPGAPVTPLTEAQQIERFLEQRIAEHGDDHWGDIRNAAVAQYGRDYRDAVNTAIGNVIKRHGYR